MSVKNQLLEFMDKFEGADLFTTGNFIYHLDLELMEVGEALIELELEGKVKELEVYYRTPGGPRTYWMRIRKDGQ